MLIAAANLSSFRTREGTHTDAVCDALTARKPAVDAGATWQFAETPPSFVASRNIREGEEALDTDGKALEKRFGRVAQLSIHNSRCRCVWMRLGFVCIHDVPDLDAVRFQVIGNERAVAAPPDGFRAHDRSWSGIGSKIEKALNTFTELVCFHVIGVTTK